MSEYTFKNLNEVNTVAEPADGTTVMGFENGAPIQMPMSAIKGSGSGGGGVFIIDKNADDYSETDTAYGDKVKEAILSGKAIYAYNFSDSTTTDSSDGKEFYRSMLHFRILHYTATTYSLYITFAGESQVKPLSLMCTAV